jgi:hypothetical protein
MSETLRLRLRAPHFYPTCQSVACQCPAPARQWREASPEGRVQALNVRCVEHTVSLRPTPESLHACQRAIDKATFGLRIGILNALFSPRHREPLPSLASASDWPALDAAGRPQVSTPGHGPDGWLVTGSLRGWGCPAGLGLIQTRCALLKRLIHKLPGRAGRPPGGRGHPRRAPGVQRRDAPPLAR